MHYQTKFYRQTKRHNYFVKTNFTQTIKLYKLKIRLHDAHIASEENALNALSKLEI